jgi:hypothetical protein
MTSAEPEFVWRPLAITALALAIYLLGSFIPLPGLDASAFAAMANGSNLSSMIGRLSIFSLGIVPWFSALLVAEFFVFLFSDIRDTSLARDGHADPFNIIVVMLALVFAIFQGSGIARALEAFPNMVMEPGITFEMTTVASLTAGTALIISLGRIVETLGIGRGFWVLYAAALLQQLPRLAAQLLESSRIGAIGPESIVVLGVAIIAVIAATLALLISRTRAGFGKFEPLVWPLILAGSAASWIALPVYDLDMNYWEPIIKVITAVLIPVFAIIYARREGSHQFVWPVIGLLLALQLAEVILPGPLYAFGSMLFGSHMIVLAAIMYKIYAEYSGEAW